MEEKSNKSVLLPRTLGIFDKIFDLVEFASAITLALVTVVAFYQIISRYIFQSSYAGIDELTRLAFVWCASLGSALAFRAKAHLGVTALVSKLHGIAHLVSEVLIDSLLVVFMMVVLVAGIQMTKMGNLQFSEYLRMNMAFFYACIPTGAFFSILVFAEDIIKLLASKEEAL